MLWVVTNEPQLAFDGLRPAAEGTAPVELVHYPAAEIAAQLHKVVEAAQNATTSGIALIFSSERQEARPATSLPSADPVAEHRAGGRATSGRTGTTSAAITLILKGEHCHSMVGDRELRLGALRHAGHAGGRARTRTTTTSGERAMFLIVQDGGLHYHARTMGFTFLDRAP